MGLFRCARGDQAPEGFIIMGVHQSHWVNGRQTKEERMLKYRYARLCGCTYAEAHQIMDWTLGHLNQFLDTNRDRLLAARRVRANKKRGSEEHGDI